MNESLNQMPHGGRTRTEAYGLTYSRNGDYLIPDLTMTEQTQLADGLRPIGKYGRMRKTYLMEHRAVLYNSLLLSEKLYPHCLEIDQTANSRLEQLMNELLQTHPAPDKATHQMEWVGHMNNLKHSAEELILTELIFN